MRTLIVNANWIGDVLFSTASIRALRKYAPGDHLACLVPRRCEPLLRGNPHLDEVIVSEEGVWRALKEKRFNRAFFFHRSASWKFSAFMAGIPERIGFGSTRRKDFFLTRTVVSPPAGTHRADHFLELLRAQGIPSNGRTPDFFPSKGAAEELTRLFAETGLDLTSGYAVVHPGGNWDLKRWPADHFSAWSRLFLERHPSWKVVLCGTAPEKELTERILKSVCSERLVSFCGRTSLDALALLLQGAKFLLSNDSGPIHLAASQGAPIVGLYGPTFVGITGPLSEGRVLILSKDVGCQVPCYFRACDTRVCLDWITPGETFEKIEAWINEPSG